MRFYTHLDQFSTTGLDIWFFSRRLFCLISRPVSFHLPFLVISFSFSHTTLYVKWKSCSKNIRHIAITKCGSTHSLRYIVYYTTYMHDRVSFFLLGVPSLLCRCALEFFCFLPTKAPHKWSLRYTLLSTKSNRSLIKCVLNKHFIRSFMYAWIRPTGRRNQININRIVTQCNATQPHRSSDANSTHFCDKIAQNSFCQFVCAWISISSQWIMISYINQRLLFQMQM